MAPAPEAAPVNPAQSQLEHLFPTTILIADHPDATRLDAQLLAHVEAVRRADPEGRVRSNNLGWQSDRLDRSQPAVLEFCRFLAEQATRFGEAHLWRFRETMGLAIPELWANVNGQYGFNRIHVHPNALVSGVYYVRVPDDSGDLILHDPRKQASVLQPELAGRNFRNVHQHVVLAREGRLVLFPSWLEHGVGQNLSAEERVSLSFNLDLLPAEMATR